MERVLGPAGHAGQLLFGRRLGRLQLAEVLEPLAGQLVQLGVQLGLLFFDRLVLEDLVKGLRGQVLQYRRQRDTSL